jgi:hypothetical protein
MPTASAEDLAHKLTEGRWTNSYELSGYLFLNDSFGAEGNKQYAVVKKPQEPGGPYVQVESVTFGSCKYDKGLELVKRAIAGEFDRSEFAHAIEQPKLEPPFESLQRYVAYLKDPFSLKHPVEALANEGSGDELTPLPEPDRIAQVTKATFDYYLDVLPPRWMKGSSFCFAEGIEPYRLFWKSGGRSFVRQLSWDETRHFLDAAQAVARRPTLGPGRVKEEQDKDRGLATEQTSVAGADAIHGADGKPEDREPADFVVEDLGSVWRFTPQTAKARAFAETELPLEPWQQGADGGFSADHRPARKLAEQLHHEGWEVAQAHAEAIRSEASQPRKDGHTARDGEEQAEARDRRGEQAHHSADARTGGKAELTAGNAVEVARGEIGVPQDRSGSDVGMRKLLAEFVEELKTGIAEGCQVVAKRDGSEEYIKYEAMDDRTKVLFLNACVDFTAYVNRGMEPAVGNRLMDNVLAGKASDQWLEGVLLGEGNEVEDRLNQTEPGQQIRTARPRNHGENMGWYYTKGATKTDIIALLTQEQPRQAASRWSNAEQRSVPCGYDFSRKTLHQCVRSSVLWTVEETIRYKEPVERDLFIGCYLLKGGRGEAGYKPMDESMGPRYCSCPLAYLDMVPEANREWREKVRAYHAERTPRRSPRQQAPEARREEPAPETAPHEAKTPTATIRATDAQGKPTLHTESTDSMSELKQIQTTRKPNDKPKPLISESIGPVRMAIWDNGPDREPTYTLQRVYRTPEGFKIGQSFYLRDLESCHKALQAVAKAVGQQLDPLAPLPAESKGQLLCTLDSGRFMAAIGMRWNPVSETYTYVTKVRCDRKPFLAPLHRHELAGIERILNDRGFQWLQEALHKGELRAATPRDLQDFTKAIHTSGQLVSQCIERGHKAVLQDPQVARELGLERSSQRGAQADTKEPEQEIEP